MAVPWLVVGKLVLNNLDTIMGVVKPAFTRKQVDALPSQTVVENRIGANSTMGSRPVPFRSRPFRFPNAVEVVASNVWKYPSSPAGSKPQMRN
jgi:hypothetical protein